jgi:hypothetical protein
MAFLIQLRAALGGLANDAEFKEQDHPRAENGQFGSGGGSGGAAKKKITSKQKSEVNALVSDPTASHQHKIAQLASYAKENPGAAAAVKKAATELTKQATRAGERGASLNAAQKQAYKEKKGQIDQIVSNSSGPIQDKVSQIISHAKGSDISQLRGYAKRAIIKLVKQEIEKEKESGSSKPEAKPASKPEAKLEAKIGSGLKIVAKSTKVNKLLTRMRNAIDVGDGDIDEKITPTASVKWWESEPPTNSQYESVKDYIGKYYTSINKYLRGEGDASKETIERINNLNELFRNKDAVLKQDLILRRGGYKSSEDIQKLIVSLNSGLPSKFTDKGFISTTTSNEFSGKGANSKVIYKILAKKGTRALSVKAISEYSAENEVILPHGQSFELLEYEFKDGVHHMTIATS